MDRILQKNIEQAQKKFLDSVKGKDEPSAVQESINASVKTRKFPIYKGTYKVNERQAFRRELTCYLREEATGYNEAVSDDIHVAKIRKICDELSEKYGYMLHNSRLRVGVVQKAFNLYLKYQWCLGLIKIPPPHCPVDRIILNKVGQNGNWTELDSIDVYLEWITQIRDFIQKEGFESIQEWELLTWNDEISRNS